MKKHLRYSLQSAHHIGKTAHAFEVMKELDITYQKATPQTMGDQWWFWNCDNIPEKLPEYLSILEINPLDAIGYGLSKEEAESISEGQDSLRIKIYPEESLNSWLKEGVYDTQPLAKFLIDRIIEKAEEEFKNKLKEYLKINLGKKGFYFETDEEFFDFCKNRVHRIGFSEEPLRHQFYLDFKNESDRGIYLGEYIESIEISQEENVIKATIGRHIPKS